MIERGFLSKVERVELRALLRRSRQEGLALRRANMLLLLDEGWSAQKVSEALYMDIFTINSVYKRFRTEGATSLNAEDITGRPVKLTDTQRTALSGHLMATHYSCSREIIAYIEAEFTIKYSKAGVLALLKRLGFEHKMTVLTVPAPALSVQQAAITAYETLKASIQSDEVIVHSDGVHPTHMPKTGRIWTKKGQVLSILSNSGRGRVNIHGALNVATGQFTFINNATIDANSTIALCKNLLEAYKEKKKIHVFLDNARYHHSKIVKEWLETHGNRIVLHFLPPYCPHLNPIERLWHILHKKVTINRFYATFNEFLQAILTFCRKTVKNDWQNIKSYVTDNLSPIYENKHISI